MKKGGVSFGETHLVDYASEFTGKGRMNGRRKHDA
jgi:hypothetical protein